MKGRKKCTITCPLIRKAANEMFRQVEESADDEHERGAILYQHPRTCRLKYLETCTGERCRLFPKNIEFGNLSFHTHPTGLPTPSHTDIVTDASRNRHFCIGAFTTPESDWESQPPRYIVNCFRPPSWAKRFNDWTYKQVARHFVYAPYEKNKNTEKLVRLVEDFYSQCRDEWGEGKPFCSLVEDPRTEKRKRRL